MAKKFFVYIRVSKDWEYDQSLEDQKAMIINKAKKDWLTEEDLIFLDEEKKSGKAWKKRDVFDHMIQELNADSEKHGSNIERRKYGWVYIFKIDRLWRSDVSFQQVFNLLDKWYEFRSCLENIQNTPTWRLLFRIIASFATYESEKLSNRESLANIYNIMRENFKSLWWTQIFWYTFAEDTKKIKIVPEEAAIIRRIYDLYMQCDLNQWFLPYIAGIINNEFHGYLKNYILNKKSAINEDRFIWNILTNDNSLRYNWYIERALNINDELIQQQIELWIKDIKNPFDIEWINKIWWKVVFVFNYPELVIVNDILYWEVERKRWKNKRKANEEKKNDDYRGMFNEILFMEYKGVEYILPSPDMKKDNYYYRKYFNDEETKKKKYFWISENEIEKRIISSWILEDFQWLVQYKDDIYRNMLEINKVDVAKELKNLRASNVLYKNAVDATDYMIENWREIEFQTKQKRKYLDSIYENELRINSLEKSSLLDVERYVDVLNIKDITKEDRYTRKTYYQALIERVVFSDTEDESEIELEPKKKSKSKKVYEPKPSTKKIKLYLFGFVSALLDLDEVIEI